MIGVLFKLRSGVVQSFKSVQDAARSMSLYKFIVGATCGRPRAFKERPYGGTTLRKERAPALHMSGVRPKKCNTDGRRGTAGDHIGSPLRILGCSRRGAPVCAPAKIPFYTAGARRRPQIFPTLLTFSLGVV